MATSPNYSWPEPDNTDLVKNGALAMRTLGNAIDTTMATMTPKSTVTAKGSLIAATAASTPANLAVGNNGETLVADSFTSTGLRWQGSQAAAKNILINGEMTCWQRGTSFSVVAFDYRYTADRWLTFNGAACTISQETSTVPSGSQYALKLTGGATTSGYEIWQIIETANAIGLAGQTATLSVYATGTTSSTCTVTLDYSTGTDTGSTGSWTAISPASSATSLTSGTFTRVSTTVSVPSTAKSLRVRITSSSLTSGQFQIYGKAQLELGSVATTFTRAGGTIQGELAACQRYYQIVGSGTTSNNNIGTGFAYLTTEIDLIIPLKVTLRTTPSLVASSGAGYFRAKNGSANLSITSWILSNNSPDQPLIYAAVTGATIGQAYQVVSDNAAASVAFSAEL